MFVRVIRKFAVIPTRVEAVSMMRAACWAFGIAVATPGPCLVRVAAPGSGPRPTREPNLGIRCAGYGRSQPPSGEEEQVQNRTRQIRRYGVADSRKVL